MFKHPNFFCYTPESPLVPFREWVLRTLRLRPVCLSGPGHSKQSRLSAADSQNLAGSYIGIPVAASRLLRTGEANSSHDPDRELVGCPEEMQCHK